MPRSRPAVNRDGVGLASAVPPQYMAEMRRSFSGRDRVACPLHDLHRGVFGESNIAADWAIGQIFLVEFEDLADVLLGGSVAGLAAELGPPLAALGDEVPVARDRRLYARQTALDPVLDQIPLELGECRIEVETGSVFEKTIAAKFPGSDIRLRVLSGGHERRVTVKLAEQPKLQAAQDQGGPLLMLDTAPNTTTSW
jgi:hypothetical protein